jgi:hypothetical protein
MPGLLHQDHQIPWRSSQPTHHPHVTYHEGCNVFRPINRLTLETSVAYAVFSHRSAAASYVHEDAWNDMLCCLYDCGPAIAPAAHACAVLASSRRRLTAGNAHGPPLSLRLGDDIAIVNIIPLTHTVLCQLLPCLGWRSLPLGLGRATYTQSAAQRKGLVSGAAAAAGIRWGAPQLLAGPCCQLPACPFL